MEKVKDDVWYFCGKKPPIPNVKARDYLVKVTKWQNDPNGPGEDAGKWTMLWQDTTDDSKKVSDEMERMEIRCISVTVEKNESGNGVKVTEYRSTDIKGEMAEASIERGSRLGPKMSYDVWKQAVEDGKYKD